MFCLTFFFSITYNGLGLTEGGGLFSTNVYSDYPNFRLPQNCLRSTKLPPIANVLLCAVLMSMVFCQTDSVNTISIYQRVFIIIISIVPFHIRIPKKGMRNV
jgi:hypothetical protein